MPFVITPHPELDGYHVFAVEGQDATRVICACLNDGVARDAMLAPGELEAILADVRERLAAAMAHM